MKDVKYKYQNQLDMLQAMGYNMPQVFEPCDKQAWRYVFSSTPERNHLPVCVANPKRELPGSLKTSGYALSCFGNESKAVVRYKALKSTFKQISLTIGDSLASGVIRNVDGRITKEDVWTSHFDFYEFDGFIPVASFNFLRIL